MDDLLARTEDRRIRALRSQGANSAALGQHFTPHSAAELIASLPVIPASGKFRLLDPGAGVGSLTAAFVDRATKEAPQLAIEVVAVELDANLSSLLDATLEDCKSTASARGSEISVKRVTANFVPVGMIDGEHHDFIDSTYDLVLMNPPYAKISRRTSRALASSLTGVECPNIYAAFVALGTRLLAKDGQIVAIVPRSFANGTYFTNFRKNFFSRNRLDKVHVFDSRSSVFKDTSVLQENLIFSATRKDSSEFDLKPPLAGTVVLSTSYGLGGDVTHRTVPFSSVVQDNDPNQFVRLLSNGEDSEFAHVMESLRFNLNELGLKVATGKVVDFRSRDYLRDNASTSDVPLIYPGNLQNGLTVWPREIRKAQGFCPSDEAAKKLLLPHGRYVAVKRFSAKEERRRIVAGVWEPDLNVPGSVAFENHLNIFQLIDGTMSLALAVGLSYWLNSTLVDKYFRIFSGHTQVNAGDLRSLRWPSISSLESLGGGQAPELPEQEKIDSLVESMLSQEVK